MQQEINKVSVVRIITRKYFVDGKANAITQIAAPVDVAGVRRFCHPDAQKYAREPAGPSSFSWRIARRAVTLPVRES